MRAIELFAGAGGLGMGVSRAGFSHDAVIEWDKGTCATIRENQRREMAPLVDWPLVEGDVRNFDFAAIPSGLDLLSGGPPCQPFSFGGKHRGPTDQRDMFPEAVRAVRELRPRAFLFENVKGLLRESFTSYFQYILLQLNHPEVVRSTEESGNDHLTRLERHHTGRHYSQDLSYRVIARLLNAADYGVPQRRERVFIIGFREDVGPHWSFPTPTHSQDSLLWEQWVTGAYWDRHCIAFKDRPPLPERVRLRVERLRGTLIPPDGLPWVTVRDALADLPEPQPDAESCSIRNIPNHRIIPGARAYPGHTGSPLDEPGKTLKAGDHGVPGGENMAAYLDGTIRYFTVRESARLQTFPDDYVFPVRWTESMRQLGNAVPVTLAHTMAASIRAKLEETTR